MFRIYCEINIISKKTIMLINKFFITLKKLILLPGLQKCAYP